MRVYEQIRPYDETVLKYIALAVSRMCLVWTWYVLEALVVSSNENAELRLCHVTARGKHFSFPEKTTSKILLAWTKATCIL